MVKAIERTITIDGIEVKFASSASIPRIYYNLFHSDFWADYDKIIKDHDYICFQNFAYAMAYHALDGDICGIDEWCSQFSIMGFMSALNGIMALLNDNQKSTAESKKN